MGIGENGWLADTLDNIHDNKPAFVGEGQVVAGGDRVKVDFGKVLFQTVGCDKRETVLGMIGVAENVNSHSNDRC